MEFGDGVTAQRVIINIFRISDTNGNLSGRYKPTRGDAIHSRYKHFIQQELNSSIYLYFISLQKNVLTHMPVSRLSSPILSHIVASTDADVNLESQSNILHLLFQEKNPFQLDRSVGTTSYLDADVECFSAIKTA